MIWWTRNDGRLDSEKAALLTLENTSVWLTTGQWHLTDDLEMAVEINITHLENTHRLLLQYPNTFPSGPPMIFTFGELLSGHQYGAHGELCLEYRPDNWHSDVTGAMMVDSAYNLLVEERPENGERRHALSAHQSSVALESRSSRFRYLVTETDLDSFNSLIPLTPVSITLNIGFSERTVVASLSSISSPQSNTELPGSIPTSTEVMERPAIAIRTNNNTSGVNGTPESIRRLLTDLGLQDEIKQLFEADDYRYIAIGHSSSWNIYALSGESDSKNVIPFKTIELSNSRDRIPNTYQSLTEKKIAIVGCGSVGSKVAASLVRSGVSQFMLVDEDIFYPENVVRNELDLICIGAHKVDGLKHRLLNINPECKVACSRFSFGGQESARLLSRVSEKLGECDLIFDATASAPVFNQLSAISTNEKIPLTWSQVFAGGIGGLIARARPNLDPPPLEGRQQINAWCENENVDWHEVVEETQYQAVAEDGEVLVADDSQVSIIAAHSTQLIIDCILRPDNSIFEYSAYMIGMSKSWLFEAPFDTYPISLSSNTDWETAKPRLSDDEIKQLIDSHTNCVD